MRKVVNVQPLEDYRILAEFDTGEKRIADIKPLLKKPVFSFLSDRTLFDRVFLQFGAVTWKDLSGDEVDICSDKLFSDSIPIAEFDM